MASGWSAPSCLALETNLAKVSRLKTPSAVQDFLTALPANFELRGETVRSPAQVLKTNMAHCLEGALLAAAVFWAEGRKPLLLDLKANRRDQDHVVTLFRERGYWGAVSKTNHAVLRYREPIYKTIRELALSYFHEYFDDQGRKNLRSYSRPFDLSILGNYWITTDKDLWEISKKLDRVRHYSLIPKLLIPKLRRADSIEIEAGKIVEWKKNKNYGSKRRRFQK